MRRLLFVLILSAAALAAPLSPDQFRSLFTQLTSSAREPWLGIPWQADLGQARALAARQGKPLFIWAMNGHPLGCT